jgi:alkaline phosphatase D
MLSALFLWKREFDSRSPISFFFCSAAIFLFSACSLKPERTHLQQQGPLSILQGRTSESEIELSILAPKGSHFRIEISNKIHSPQEPVLRRKAPIPESLWLVEKIKFENLSAGETYILRIFSEAGDLVDERTLKTFTKNSGKLRFAMISCTDDHFKSEQKTMWDHLKEAAPQIVFHLGDHVYADKVNGTPIWEADSKTLWKRYLQTRQALDVFYWKNLVPMMLLWDDHDYGQSDGDVRYGNKQLATEIFEIFSAQSFPVKGFERGPGVSWSWRRQDQDFFFLDGRSFRSPNKRSPVCLSSSSRLCKKLPDHSGFPETHFGQETEGWLFESLHTSHKPTWLFTGDQWFGGFSPFESYEGNATEDFKRFASRLARLPKTFVFGSGDRHSIELMEIAKGPLDFVTYEITSSPLHAKTFPEPWTEFPNPRNLEQFSGIFNFIMIEASPSKSKTGLEFQAEGIGSEGQSLFKRKFQVQDPQALKSRSSIHRADPQASRNL